MYCTNCGVMRPIGATACSNCGMSFQVAPASNPNQPAVPNYLVGSILATLCCCVPLGIVSIVYAAQVNARLSAGDLAGAMDSSRKARTWLIVSVVSGGLLAVLYAIATILGATASQ